MDTVTKRPAGALSSKARQSPTMANNGATLTKRWKTLDHLAKQAGLMTEIHKPDSTRAAPPPRHGR